MGELDRQTHFDGARKLRIPPALRRLDAVPQCFPIMSPRRRARRRHDFGVLHTVLVRVVVGDAVARIAKTRRGARGRDGDDPLPTCP